METTNPINIVGAYRLNATQDLIGEATGVIGSREGAIEFLKSVILVEVKIGPCKGTLNVSAFMLIDPRVKPAHYQVAYEPFLLSADGKINAGMIGYKEKKSLDLSKGLRLAFWLHDYREGVPLASSFGLMNLPGVEAVPSRLSRISRYVFPD